MVKEMVPVGIDVAANQPIGRVPPTMVTEYTLKIAGWVSSREAGLLPVGLFSAPEKAYSKRRPLIRLFSLSLSKGTTSRLIFRWVGS
jgi:hypothetical protein